MHPYILTLLSLCTLAFAPPTSNPPDFGEFRTEFLQGYLDLDIPGMQISYVDYLTNLHQQDNLAEQKTFFEEAQRALKNYTPEEFTEEADRTAYHIIAFEVRLHRERILLSEQLQVDYPDGDIPTGGLAEVKNGKAWYVYLLQRWLAAPVEVEDIYDYGATATAKVQAEMAAIQEACGMSEDAFYAYLQDEQFFSDDRDAVRRAFQETQDTARKYLPRLFHHPDRVPLANIAVGDNPNLKQTPGYYQNTNGGTFYYNLFDEPYNLRQTDWLFVHEASPGHHFQSSIARSLDLLPEQGMAFYGGYVEGYAAYVEEMGHELGLYRTPYHYFSKWEWDIVRSVRVVLDVALNYYNWTDEQALEFWKRNIRNQDDIAQREIDRMRRWPAQVVTYKYGSEQIQRWKQEWQARQGVDFDIRDFHEQLLACGPMPFPALEELMK